MARRRPRRNRRFPRPGGGLLEQVGGHLGHPLVSAASGSLGDLLRAQIGYADRAQELLLATGLGRVQLLRGRGALPVFLDLRFQLGLPGCLASRLTLRVELSPAFAPIPIFAGLTGLRCSEWLALERGDIDRHSGVVHVRRVFVDGQMKLYGKQSGSLRTVPLPLRAAESLSALPPRLDTPLLFPGVRGGYLNLHEWRRDKWTPAVKGAGLEHRSPYALRHTFASFAIAASVPLFELSRFMGTSVEQIGRTYGHLLPDSLDRARTALDVFLATEGKAHEAGNR